MNNISSEIPREISDIFVDLDFIAKTPTLHKLNTKDRTYANASSWIDAGYRLFVYHEDCDMAIDYINDSITRAIEIARKYPNWKDFIQERVVKISDGLSNLRYTYSLIPKYAGNLSKFDLIKLRIDSKAFSTAVDTSSKTSINKILESPLLSRFPGLGQIIPHPAARSSINTDLKKSRSVGDLPQEEKLGSRVDID